MAKPPPQNRQPTFKSTETGIAYDRVWSTVSMVSRLPDSQNHDLKGTGPEIARQMDSLDASFPRPELLAAMGKLQCRIFELDNIQTFGLNFWQKTSLSIFRLAVVRASSETADLLAFKALATPVPQRIKHRVETLAGVQLSTEDETTLKTVALTRSPSGLPKGSMPKLMYIKTHWTEAEVESLGEARENAAGPDGSAYGAVIDSLYSSAEVAATPSHPANELGVIVDRLATAVDEEWEMGLLDAGPFEMAEAQPSYP